MSSPVKELSEGITNFLISDALSSLTSISPLSSLIFHSKKSHHFWGFLALGTQILLSLILQGRDKIFIHQEDTIIFTFQNKLVMINNVFVTPFNEKYPVISVYPANFTCSH